MAQNFLSQIYANHGIRIDDALQDGTGLPGTAGQILSSNATGVSWIDPSALPAGAAETVEIQVKNTSGGILTKGTPVYIKPSTSAIDRVEVAAADAGDSTKMPAVGLLAQDLNNQATGVAITGGMLTNFTTDPIDGSTPTSNDTVYVKVGGGLTLTKPTGATGLIQNIAKVGKVSGGNSGSLVVSSILRTNDVPNLPTGRIWVGDGNTIASTVVFIDETNGFFGINNATPTAQLDVTGKVNFEDLKLDGELLDQFNSPGANGMILQSLKLGPTNPQGINWVSAGQIVVTGIQENNNTAFIDVTAAGLGAGYVTGPVTISAELSASGTPTSANFLRGDNTWATAVTGLTVGNSNFIDLSNVGTATVPDITATLSASGTPLATNFLSGDNTWKQIEIASGNTNTLTVAFTNKNVLTVQTPGVGAATLGLATGKQIHDYIAGLTVDDLSPPTADFDVNNNKILNLTTPTLADDAANKAYVDNVLAGSGALIYQGGYNASTNTPDLTSSPNSIIQGWTYAVTVAGDASGFWSPSLNIGDLVIANVDNPTSISEWTEVQANIDVATAGTSVTSVKGIAGFNEDDFTAVNGFVSVKDDTYVPYTGATTDVDLGANNLIVDTNTLYVDSANNRVGIGTTIPAELLYVNASSGDARIGLNAVAGSDTEIKFSNAGTVQYSIGHDDGTDNFVIGTANVDTPKVSITKNGNVGIGTDSPALNASFDRVLHIHSPLGSLVKLTDNSTGSGALNGTDLLQYGFDFYIVNRENGDIRISTNSTERMRIKAGGDISFQDTSANEAFYWDASAARLGIGTGSSPSFKLDVNGGSDNNIAQFSSTDGLAYISFKDNSTTSDTSVALGADGDEMTFYTGTSFGTERMRIDSSGVVQVRNTEPILQLYNTDTSLVFDQVLGGLEFYGIDPSGAGVGIRSAIRSTSDSSVGAAYGLKFYTSSSTSNDIQRMNIWSSGDIGFMDTSANEAFYWDASAASLGIGTDSPDTQLHISSASSTPTARIESTHPSGIPFLDLKGATSSQIRYIDETGTIQTRIDMSDNGGFSFVDVAGSASPRMVINSSGNVGIGTTSPTQLFEVAGGTQIKSNGVVYLGYTDATAFGGYKLEVNGKIRIGGDGYFSGNVGIGTDSPSTELHVKGSAEIFRIDDSSSTGSPFMTFSQNGTRRSLIQYLDSGDLLSLVSEYGGIRFMTGTGGTEVERMRITSAGGVSFGTSGTNYGTTGQILTSNGNASPTWGGVTYAGLGPEFTDTDAGTTSLTLNFSTDQIFTRTVGGTYTVSGAQPGMVKQLITTGGSTFSITNGKLIAGSYDGTVTNFIQIAVQTSTSFWFSISQ